MRKLPIKLFFVLVLFSIFSFLPQNPPKDISKAELLQLYKTYYLSSRIDSINWTSSGKCDIGVIPADMYKKVENRINFFRLVNRLPVIKIVDDKKEEAQSAAFMMQENNSLSHMPAPFWKCYTEKGKEGAMNSCLGIFNYGPFKEPTFITDYLRDAGELNSFVGHRRWLLSSAAKKFSYGATKKTDVLYCFPELPKDTLKTSFIAYPWSGCVPHNLIFPKWSFAIPAIHKVDFSKMKLTISSSDGTTLPYKLLQRNDDYPDHVIVWKMPAMFTDEDENKFRNNLKEKGFIDKTITIKIENVLVNGKTKNFEYKVNIVEL